VYQVLTLGYGHGNSPVRVARWCGIVSVAVIPLIAAILGAGCATQSQPASNPEALQISLEFRPNPIHIGPEQLTAIVTDSSGKPVLGADVVLITSTPAMKPNVPMKAEGMGRTGVAYRARELRGGKYTLAIDIREPGFWHFEVRAATKNGSGDVLYHAQVTGR
jgi:hypothetical protein